MVTICGVSYRCDVKDVVSERGTWVVSTLIGYRCGGDGVGVGVVGGVGVSRGRCQCGGGVGVRQVLVWARCRCEGRGWCRCGVVRGIGMKDVKGAGAENETGSVRRHCRGEEGGKGIGNTD